MPPMHGDGHGRPISHQDFTHFFEAEKRRLLESTIALQISADMDVGSMSDESDVTARSIEKNLALRLHGRERAYLKKVFESLKRLQEGAFFECIDCGGAIGLGRLQARPTTTLCISCKEDQERRERTYIQATVLG